MNNRQHHLAAPGSVQHEPDDDTNDNSNRNDQEIVSDIEEGTQFDIAEERIGLGDEERRDAPDQLHYVFEDKEHTVGDQDDNDVVAIVEMTKEAAFQ